MDSASNTINKMFDSIKDFNNDVALVVTKKDTDPEAENLRIYSLAARVAGVFMTQHRRSSFLWAGSNTCWVWWYISSLWINVCSFFCTCS
jgi:hypothetical protein